MKKLYFLLLAWLCWNGMVTAQECEYTPLVQEGVRWVYLYSDVTADDIYDPVTDEDYPIWLGKGDYAYFMEFRGDTIINGTAYKKLYSSLSRQFDEKKMRPVAYLREADKRVYGISDPEGRYQYVPTHNMALPLGGMAVYGNNAPWEEYLLYDFGDIEAFAREALSYYYGEQITAKPFTTTVNGEPRNAYTISIGEWMSFNIVEGIGNEYGNLLSFGPDDVPTCICPIPLGLAQQEYLDGNVTYRGKYFYGPYQGGARIDVETVNHIINLILRYKIYSRHYLDDMSDLNGDYRIDVNDVNTAINWILKLNQ